MICAVVKGERQFDPSWSVSQDDTKDHNCCVCSLPIYVFRRLVRDEFNNKHRLSQWESLKLLTINV